MAFCGAMPYWLVTTGPEAEPGWLAYAKDPEGHVFGMMQPDPSAK
jgi:predicted enzyme related to lactoylglutathione lyase